MQETKTPPPPARRRQRLSLAAAGVACAFAAQAQTSADTGVQTVVITAPAVKPLTRVTEDVAASPASVTVIRRAELDQKTINTYGDILRSATGFSVVEYGQGLVAYGVQVRGFDEGHGRNIAVALDGMPLNVTGSQHTNGYADQAQLIPELLDRVEIVRGPFSVLAGNHAVGGSIQYTTEARRESMFKATVDNFGRVRLLPIGSFELGAGRALVALDATKGSGYNDQSDIRRLNLFTRWQFPVAAGLASVRLQAYDADAQSPGYLNRQRVDSGEIPARAALSRGIGDAKTQQNLVFNFRSDDNEGREGWSAGWFASLYFNHDIRKRWTNYDLDGPIGASVTLGQERDVLNQTGLDLRKTQSFQLGSAPAQWLLGLQFNEERINALQFKTDADHRPLLPSAAVADVVGVDRRVKTTTQALYTQLQLQPLAAVKLTAGLRWDRLHFDIDLHPGDDTYAPALASGTPVSVGRTSTQLSPKLGLAWAVLESSRDRLDVFANVARGLKSPYAFSDFYANVGLGAVPDLSISSLRSTELGLQGGASDGRWQWRAAGWNTRQDKEADRNAAGFLQSFKKTQRDGFDIEGSLGISALTRLFANYSQVRARIEAPATPGADRIPNVPRFTATLGGSTVLPKGLAPLRLSLSDTIVGPEPITSDASLSTQTYHRLTARASTPLPGLKGASVSLSLVAISRPNEEPAFDFGGGEVGITPKPRLRATLGFQVPL
jgi:outer membrane receptor protein involved in Fe transport